MTQSNVELVARYEKARILSKLDESANDPIVSQLLLDVLTTRGEFDLARVEAATIVSLYIDESSSLERPLKELVWKIFANKDEDILVRQHASQRIEAGYGSAAELHIIESVLFNEDEDESIRHGAFSYLESIKESAFVQRLIPRLLNHGYWSKFGSSIRRLQAGG